MNAKRRWHLHAVGGVLLVFAAGRQTPVKADAAFQTLKLAPDKIDFGSVSVGSHSQLQTVTLTNTTASPLPISSILVSGIDFTQNNNCGMQLAPNAQCSIQVTFQPAISGPRLGTLIITSANDTASPHLLVLNGTGEDPR